MKNLLKKTYNICSTTLLGDFLTAEDVSEELKEAALNSMMI